MCRGGGVGGQTSAANLRQLNQSEASGRGTAEYLHNLSEMSQQIAAVGNVQLKVK